MADAELTPCGALFETMKKHGKMSYKELASLILSGRPLADGRSPVSRVDDRTWVSRFIVHAPVGSLQERYFSDYGVAALRIIARLKTRSKNAMTGDEVLLMLRGAGCQAMESALADCHQDVSLYRNILDRLLGGTGYTVDEHVEGVMVLFVAAGCTADVRKAAAYAISYVESIHGGRLKTTPVVGLHDARGTAKVQPPLFLGLLRVVDDYVKGDPHWINPSGEGAEIGALVLGPDDISDVGAGVSARHARVWFDTEGRWLVQGLGSRNGTVLVSGADCSRIDIEKPSGERDADESRSIEIHAGDELILADDTRFAIIEGFPENVEAR